MLRCIVFRNLRIVIKTYIDVYVDILAVLLYETSLLLAYTDTNNTCYIITIDCRMSIKPIQFGH